MQLHCCLQEKQQERRSWLCTHGVITFTFIITAQLLFSWNTGVGCSASFSPSLLLLPFSASLTLSTLRLQVKPKLCVLFSCSFRLVQTNVLYADLSRLYQFCLLFILLQSLLPLTMMTRKPVSYTIICFFNGITLGIPWRRCLCVYSSVSRASVYVTDKNVSIMLRTLPLFLTLYTVYLRVASNAHLPAEHVDRN